MKKITLFIFLVFLTVTAFGQSLTSNGNGDWTSTGSWVEGRIPQGGDAITILAGETITISSKVSISGSPVVLHIYGTLYFAQAGQLELPSGSEIYIYSGGDVEVEDTGNNSTKLIIGSNSNQLSGADLDAVTGPAYLDETNLSTGGTTLPVTLLYFKANAEPTAVAVSWASSKAWDFSHYELERSVDGKDFYKIADIDAAENSDFTETYTYTDYQPLSGTSYYRLKAVDIDGAFEYKGVEVVKFGTESFKVYPNPATQGYIDIAWSHATEGTTISLKDHMGRTIRTGKLEGDTRLSTEGLAAGLYVLVLEGPAGRKQSQLVIR